MTNSESSKSLQRTVLIALTALIAGIGAGIMACSMGLLPDWNGGKLDGRTARLVEDETKSIAVARVYSEIGPAQEAGNISMEGIARTKSLDLPTIKLAHYTNLMHTRTRDNQFNKAESAYKSALSTFERCKKAHGKPTSEDLLLMAYIEILAGKAASLNDKFEMAKARFEKAASLAESLPKSEWLKAYVDDRLMLLCYKFHKYENAIKYGDQVLMFVEANGDTAYGGDSATDTLKILCASAMAAGQNELSQRYAEKGLALAGDEDAKFSFGLYQRLAQRGGFASFGKGAAEGGGFAGRRAGFGSGSRADGGGSEDADDRGESGSRRRGHGMHRFQPSLPQLD